MPARFAAALADGLPRFPVENFRVELQFPNDFERLALRVVVETGHADQRARAWGGMDGLNEVGAGAKANDLAGLRCVCALCAGSNRGDLRRSGHAQLLVIKLTTAGQWGSPLQAPTVLGRIRMPEDKVPREARKGKEVGETRQREGGGCEAARSPLETTRTLGRGQQTRAAWQGSEHKTAMPPKPKGRAGRPVPGDAANCVECGFPVTDLA